jgi:hypothetical protein
MWKVIVTTLIGLVAVTMCQDRPAVAPRSHTSTASPNLDAGVFEGRTYKNAQIGLELTLAPALKFGFPELMESPARLDSVTAWDPYVREGIIFTANALSYYAVELRSTESRMQSLVHDLHQVGFERLEGTTESKLGAAEFARRDFEKVGDTHPAMPAYETVFVRACAARELVFIFYGPDRDSVKKLVTETELKFDLKTSGCAPTTGGLPKK